MGFFYRIRPDQGFVSPVRSDPISLLSVRSDPIRSDPGFVNGQPAKTTWPPSDLENGAILAELAPGRLNEIFQSLTECFSRVQTKISQKFK